MKANLPQRKNIRLKHYNYSNNGMYFITICIKDKQKILGHIDNCSNMKLTEIGYIVEQYIHSIEATYPGIYVDEYIVMPNHIHLLLIIGDSESITISRIIKQFKECITKKLGYSIWQKLFYDHVIRNEQEYLAIKEYIHNNVIRWNDDCYF